MKLLKNYFLPLFIVFAFAACDSDDNNDIIEPPITEYNLTKLEVTFADQVKRPLFDLTYDDNNKLTQAVYYFYNIGEEDGDETDVKLDETMTYHFIHSADIISVNCIRINHTKDDAKSEWITTLTTSNGRIVKASNVNNKGKTIVYTWENNKLKKVFNYDFTYNGSNVEKAIEAHEYSDDYYIRENTCSYALTCNTNKTNPFAYIPLELLAVMDSDGDNMDILPLVLSANEVQQVVHNDEAKMKKSPDNNVEWESMVKETINYTYTRDNNNLVTTATTQQTDYFSLTHHVDSQWNVEETTDGGSTLMHFTYVER
ncbi:hypothetical protein M2451_002111 [Dysgonomonas sp. PFB1-18]|uniref:hypothetical protein n=1 Tax=unclassified Dysgonomonas TaxID=2630389 RepID=UPI00247721F8|nr:MULTISPECIES: hypothetical protein [unclassified Dysgonomonas]MDH6309705.1 hypothetical protein [Dysgonomonas sp. PF1-14]MDH6339287.1 hypothetical protein [Dysgonomonas sp. PF1-16]MDH6380786.1 hypothetical protein [Dysgonomonas sp. PFB1-18]MDH6398282.1 hypothetical protein [Dysgonomonas sp. PF1-23]